MVFRENHILPTVRIQKIELENFKSIIHGEVLFNCGRKNIPQDTESDILGIYGQNGSGKTSVIEAISILKHAMSGDSIPIRYSECIAYGAEFAKLTFIFDFQYPAEILYTRTITYSFKIEAVPNDKVTDDYDDRRPISSLFPKKVRIFDETISASGLFGGEIQKKQDILTSSGVNYPFGPFRKIPNYVGENKDKVRIDLEVNKRTADKDAKSFIFMEETINIFSQNSNYSEYFQILLELRYYSDLYLYAIDTHISTVGIIPISGRLGIQIIDLLRPTKMSQKYYSLLEAVVDGINTVLPALVTDLKLEMVHDEFVSEGVNGVEVQLYSKRKDTIIPLRDESSGIIKLVSILSLIIATFNDRSVTVAVDELDAGIYEYLLGEILNSLETYGKGQLIFTSHNLRPLEVLKKESIIFTTTNPENRFIRLKGVGQTNNLRSLYLREILGNNQYESIYDAAKRQRMIAAFMKAGDGFGQKK